MRIISNENEWLNLHLQKLLPLSNQLSETYPDIIYEKRGWSALKLICLTFYIEVYTKIISKRFNKMVYIDLLAGSGINKIKRTGDKIIGSPLIAAMTTPPFNKLVFVESDVKKSRALEYRLNQVIDKNRFNVHPANSDDIIDTIIEDHLSMEMSHYLAFVDCEGLDISWNTIEKLLQYKGDLIFNFQTSEINRTLGAYQSGRIPNETMYRFFGNVGFESANSATDLLEMYKNNLQKHRGLVEDITIKGGSRFGNFHYNLIFAAKETRNGSPWFKSIKDLKLRIEMHSGDAVDIALDVLTGRQKNLDWFLNNGKDVNNQQRSLSDFNLNGTDCEEKAHKGEDY